MRKPERAREKIDLPSVLSANQRRRKNMRSVRACVRSSAFAGQNSFRDAYDRSRRGRALLLPVGLEEGLSVPGRPPVRLGGKTVKVTRIEKCETTW